MKDYFKFKKRFNNKYYLNEKNEYHRLTGPAIEYKYGDKSYYINDFFYMKYYKNKNKLCFHTNILQLNSQYEEYIKQNIKNLIEEYNSKIELPTQLEKKEEINQLPNWLKDFIIL